MKIKTDEKKEKGWVYQPATDGCRFVPLVYPQWTIESRAKNFPNCVNCQMVCFIFVFELYIEKFQIFGPIVYSLKISFYKWTNTMTFYQVQQVQYF